MVPRIAPHVAWQIVDGEAVVVDLASGKTVGLNAAGTFLWLQINGEHDHATMASALAAEFDISADMAESDTNEFLAGMNERALIVDCTEDGS